MKKIVRLSESDIARIVNKVINEQQDNRTGDLYAAVNSLIDDEYNDVDYEDVANVLENILMICLGIGMVQRKVTMKKWNQEKNTQVQTNITTHLTRMGFFIIYFLEILLS